MNVPKIRIKGFDGEWVDCAVKDMLRHEASALFQNQLGEDNGAYPVYGASGYIQQIDSYAQSEDYIGVVKDGAGVGRINLYPAYSSVLGTLHYLKAVDNNDIHFLCNLLQTKDLSSFSTGSTIPHIYFKDYADMEISVPSADEQQQIAEYFRQLDLLIESTGKKIASLKQTKRACLQSMFPQPGETTPRIRFKGFEGDWAILPLSTFAQKSKEKNMSREYTAVLTNSAEYGVINQKDFFDHDIANDNHIDRYSVIHNDDFVYNPRVSVSAPVGPINRNMLGYSGVMSPLYLIFKVENIDKEYLSYFFKTKLWHPYMKIEGNTGARFDRFALSDTQFFGLPIYAPKEEAEQQQIAAFFSNMDKQIRIQEQRLEKLKQIKAACLEKMFV